VQSTGTIIYYSKKPHFGGEKLKKLLKSIFYEASRMKTKKNLLDFL
jgi:hypothetical protein